MARSQNTYADFEGLREQAVALRRAGYSLRQIRDELKVFNNDILNRLLAGEAPPEWTKRPNAKDDVRDRARELRLQGWTYDQIQVELGCSKSSISLWVRELPKPERPIRTREQASAIARKGWEAKLRVREEERQQTRQRAAAEMGKLTDRELFVAGVALYWAEGSKSKPYSRRERVSFVNSDPDVISLFLDWLRLLRVDPSSVRFAVQIHETADVAEAEAYWATHVDIHTTDLMKTTLKRHNPRTNRKNISESYRGCLRIDVRDGAELYRRIEGWWYGIVGVASAADLENRT
ncbi:terminase gpP N-terminus-related DNA-binding protein [Streptomyces olivaceus]|uniref:terminase gpP N-terminus-related DNA-binding protein n=1 Tax=Streptomyces olivaceus TaxID=47716 RepID=UPI00355606F0